MYENDIEQGEESFAYWLDDLENELASRGRSIDEFPMNIVESFYDDFCGVVTTADSLIEGDY